MLKRFSLLLVVLPLCSGVAPTRASESETFAAAQDFISALNSLDAALQSLHELVKADKLNGSDVGPICGALNPDPNEPPDTPDSLSELLKKADISRGDARALCAAVDAVRAVSEQAKTANLRAAAECKATRIPACDIANEVVAAQRETRARMETGGAK
jgi:hypothetical protein